MAATGGGSSNWWWWWGEEVTEECSVDVLINSRCIKQHMNSL